MASRISPFKAKIFSDSENRRIILFSGAINEEAKLPNLLEFKGEPLYIDLEGVTFINSLGIRKWMQWTNGLDGFEIIFLRVPPVFVDQVNVVDGFLPGKAKVASFFAPYVCEKCEAEQLQLFREGHEFGPKRSLEIPPVTCPDCKASMEISGVAEKYFHFLGIKR